MSAPSDTEATLVSPPGHIDLHKLANDTSHALEKLEPIYIEGNKRAFFGFGGPPRIMKEVATETTGYVRAINGSIDASKFGHTLAEEAIGVTEYILRKGALTPDLDDYTSTASDLAKQGKDKAAAALELFLNAKTKVNALVSKYDKEGQIQEGDKAMVKDCLDALVVLQSTLDDYVGWWNEMDMKHSTIHDRVQLKFNPIRYRTLLDAWQDLKAKYVVYNTKIKLAQSKFPNAFKAVT